MNQKLCNKIIKKKNSRAFSLKIQTLSFLSEEIVSFIEQETLLCLHAHFNDD